MAPEPTLEEQLLHLRLDGWCVVKDVIPREEVAAVRESVAEATLRHQRPDAPANIGHRTGLINYDQSFAPYLVTPHFIELIRATLGQNVRVSFTSAMINYPGQCARRASRGLAL